MEKVRLSRPNLLSENAGNSTWEFESVSPSKGRILAFRQMGSQSGNHWHEGRSSAKNPEELLLVSGEVLIEWSDEPEQEYGHQVTAQAPCLIHIYPFTKHRLTALTDIAFLEANSIEEHREDTHYPA